jgi:hypothetical protein
VSGGLCGGGGKKKCKDEELEPGHVHESY